MKKSEIFFISKPYYRILSEKGIDIEQIYKRKFKQIPSELRANILSFDHEVKVTLGIGWSPVEDTGYLQSYISTSKTSDAEILNNLNDHVKAILLERTLIIVLDETVCTKLEEPIMHKCLYKAVCDQHSITLASTVRYGRLLREYLLQLNRS